ncbi:MAG: hypothetical protein HY939_00770 [Gammaproteobacteria bacterium]|nr:hypothetical protein [Gammaproteobacteria bacterium]
MPLPLLSQVNEIFLLDDLQPGDILLFLPWNKNIPFLNKVIMFFQSLFHWRCGYHTATHAAIYLGLKEAGHEIAHVAEKGYSFRCDTLEGIEQEEKEKRPFVIFRSKDPAVSKKLTDVVLDLKEKIEKNHLKVKWSFFSAAKSILRSSSLLPDRKQKERKISSNTHCSRFVMQCIKMIYADLNKPRFNLRSSITPACLLKLLNEDDSFERFHYSAKIDAYDILKKISLNNLFRIRLRKDKPSQRKFKKCVDTFNKIVQLLDDSRDESNFKKAAIFYSEMESVFSEKTGLKLCKTTTSSYNLGKAARHLGIFNSDVEVCQAEEKRLPYRMLKNKC